jgi:hypothetical protein
MNGSIYATWHDNEVTMTMIGMLGADWPGRPGAITGTAAK